MKRNQNEENCGHWEYETPHEFASSDGVLDGSLMPSFCGINIRQFRYILLQNQDRAGELLSLEDVIGLDGDYQKTEGSRGGMAVVERAASPRALFTVDETTERSLNSQEQDASTVCAGYSLSNISKDPLCEVHEDDEPNLSEHIVHRLTRKPNNAVFPAVRESESIIESDEIIRSQFEVDSEKENRKPYTEVVERRGRSPLPEWYPRRPLLDITNAPAFDLYDVLPQPKKKRNKMTDGMGPPLPTLIQTPSRKECLGVSRPTMRRGAASRQVFNLNQSFR